MRFFLAVATLALAVGCSRPPVAPPTAARAISPWLTVVVEPLTEDILVAGRSEAAHVTARIEAAARAGNRWSMPFPVELRVATCGNFDTRFDLEERRITICWEFIAMADHAVPGAGRYVAHFAALHGIAHALINGLALEPSVDLEAAADAFAVITLLDGDDPEQAMAVTLTSDFLFRLARTDPPRPAEDQQALRERGAALMCLAVGSGSPALAELPRVEAPPQPLEPCRQRFQRARAEWDELLGRYSPVAAGSAP